MSRLANSERGLSPFALRQLYLACVTSIADYGSIIWWKGQSQLERQLQGLRTPEPSGKEDTGGFQNCPDQTNEIEAALAPPSVRINSNIRKYALRMLKLAPDHPINLETPSREDLDMDSDSSSLYQSKARPTQQERIRDSINGLADLESLEPIVHFKFPPWNRELPYQVEISKLSKEEEAAIHIQQLLDDQDKPITRLYTDASANCFPESRAIGVGLAVIKQGRTIHQLQQNLGDVQLVYNGELLGATLAIEYASQIAQPGQHFKIYSDNQAGLYRLATTSDNPGQAYQIRAIQAAKQIV
jgi:hypothetical protein